MKRITLVFLAVLLCTSLTWAQQTVVPAKVIYPAKMTISQPLRDLARPVPAYNDGIPSRQSPNHSAMVTASKTNGVASADAVWQKTQGTAFAGPLITNFAGLSVHENPSHIEPGQPSLEVGPTDDIIQMVKAVFAVADRNGVPKVGPSLNSDLWLGFGGDCEFNNDGDATVLYDPLADRWLLSQHVFSQKECFAISQTSDPTGAYYLYEFATPGNDNPRVGVWSDAYWAVSFSLEGLLPGADNFLPADDDGVTPPPAGTPGIFLGMEDPSILQSHLVMFEFSVDWSNTANSTLTGPTNIPVSQFDGSLCNFSPDCIRQPNTTQRLDALSGTMMHRVAYRNFGTHEAIVANHTVDLGDFPDHAASRWYEGRKSGSGWSVHQEGTYGPDTDSRWNASIAMNANGDIMMGYTVSSVITIPTIRYVGRQASDPLGQMTFAEGTLIESFGSQIGSNTWGDFSSTVVDPADDLSFWHTNYWMEGDNDDWHTWIGKFQATTAPPNLTITLTPSNPNIIIPAGGGSFTYDITIAHVGGTAVTTQIWTLIDRPDGGTAGPTIGPNKRAFLPGELINKTGIIQNIPAHAPAGNYLFNFNAGRYAPNPLSTNIIAGDSFPFTKSAGPATKSGNGSETVMNWNTSWENKALTADIAPETFVLEQNYP